MVYTQIMKVVIICIFVVSIAYATICKSSEYCPLGWVVKRTGKEYAAVTCNPIQKKPRCPKPYSCVYSPCGLSFCCVNQKLLVLHEEDLGSRDTSAVPAEQYEL